MITKSDLLAWKNCYKKNLYESVLPFWLECGLDNEYGGIITGLDAEGKVIDSDKGVWQQGRFAWMLGHLYNNDQKNPVWLDAMESTLQFMRNYCFDQDGRMFFHVTREGAPIRKRRYCFSEAFAAVALGEHARATGSDLSAAMARQLYRIYAEHVPFPPKTYATRPYRSLAGPMIQLFMVQQLRNSIGFNEADAEADRLIEDIRINFVHDELQCCLENVRPDGQPDREHFDGRILNPGHSLEAAWFIMSEGKRRHIREYIELGCRILDYMFVRGWDWDYGGLFYFRDLENLPVAEYWQDMKFWWNHNETLIATLLAWQLTRESRYEKWYRLVHDYTYQHFPDPAGREWFGYLRRDGQVSTPLKGNLYKGCFHIPRQQYLCLNIVNELLDIL